MKTNISAHFDEMAHNRDDHISNDVILNYEQKLRADAVLGFLNPEQKDEILEVGCGNGRDLLEIAKTGCKLTGIDISEEMLEGAKKQLAPLKQAQVNIMYADVTKLDFKDNSFDKIIASEVLEHIPEFEKALAEMARVLKPGGELVVSTPNWLSMHGFERFFFYNLLGKKDNHPYDKWKSYQILKTSIEKTSLKVVDYKSVCFIPGFVIVNNLPLGVKKMVVKLVALTEPFLNKLFPKLGYIISLKATKPTD